MLQYESLSEQLTVRMTEESKNGTYARVGFPNEKALRRREGADDNASIWRPAFVKDIDKILHCPYYNRYTDKTQVFSLIKNDDITRRSLHVQLVSRIARTIGGALHLNTDLIEAIALGHDIGHPPFAHMGEYYLDEIHFSRTGRHFSHNIHSVRVLDEIYPLNLSLQTLAGIAGHNGEMELKEYHPVPVNGFAEFDRLIELTYTDKRMSSMIQPSTLEGNVVRISDIIAYLGKDRQDAARANLVPEEAFASTGIGSFNAEIINNLVVNIIENSYGKPFIMLDEKHFTALRSAKRDNYAIIYQNTGSRAQLDATAKPMMAEMYDRLLDDVINRRTDSPIYFHHIDYVNKTHYKRRRPYEETDPHQIVVDYIASMTDDYFIELHRYLFPQSDLRVTYKGYFEQ